MEKELVAIFSRTIHAHFPTKTGITKNDYLIRFKKILANEITDSPNLDIDKGDLATYIWAGRQPSSKNSSEMGNCKAWGRYGNRGSEIVRYCRRDVGRNRIR